MNLIIVDCEKEINNINEKLKNENNEIHYIFEINNIDISKYKKIFLISIFEKHFLSFDSQKLLMDFKSEIFLFPVINNDFESTYLLETWIYPLNKYFETKIIHHKIVNYENYLELFIKYFEYVTSEKYEQDIELAENEKIEKIQCQKNEQIIAIPYTNRIPMFFPYSSGCILLCRSEGSNRMQLSRIRRIILLSL